RARQTCFCGLLRSSTIACRRFRSVRLRWTVMPVRIPQTRAPATARESHEGLLSRRQSTRWAWPKHDDGLHTYDRFSPFGTLCRCPNRCLLRADLCRSPALLEGRCPGQTRRAHRRKVMDRSTPVPPFDSGQTEASAVRMTKRAAEDTGAVMLLAIAAPRRGVESCLMQSSEEEMVADTRWISEIRLFVSSYMAAGRPSNSSSRLISKPFPRTVGASPS